MLNLKRALAIASAVLAISVTGSVGSHAAGAVKAAKAAKPAMAKSKPAVKAKTMKASAKKGPGLCGTYMYWKGGKCMDARLKK